jgi:hypothetical protein
MRERPIDGSRDQAEISHRIQLPLVESRRRDILNLVLKWIRWSRASTDFVPYLCKVKKRVRTIEPETFEICSGEPQEERLQDAHEEAESTKRKRGKSSRSIQV